MAMFQLMEMRQLANFKAGLEPDILRAYRSAVGRRAAKANRIAKTASLYAEIRKRAAELQSVDPTWCGEALRERLNELYHWNQRTIRRALAR